jgi:DNA primase
MDFAAQLKSSIDIVRVIGEYVRLRRVGATGRYTGLCPFHQERTPSFSVHQGRQFYKCFGCGAGGDALNFVMEIEGLTFPEALKLLAERNGIPMPKRSEYSDAESRLRGALLEMHAIAARSFAEALHGPQGAEARGYLARRGVSQEMIEVFELGYAEPGGQALLRRLAEHSFTEQQLEASGLVRKRTEGSGFYDAFRGRLMFPIHNESGKVIGFGGRAMRDEDQPKYLNSPETPIYRKTSVVYNLHRAREGMRRSNRVVLVEGYMDVIGVFSAGVKEVVASCGTALTEPQVRSIHRHADTVVVNFDPDMAGANAAERAIQLLLDEGLRVKVVTLEGGLDPDEYVKAHGADAYAKKLESAGGYFHWLADRARGKHDMRTPEGRTDAFKFLLPSVQKIPDKLERAAVANDLAAYLGVEPSLVLDQFRRAATERKAQPHSAPPRVVLPAMERILINAAFASERVREEILPQLTREMTAGWALREVFEAVRQVLNVGGAFTFAAVEGRLSEPARRLLHEAVAADDNSDESLAWDQAEACLRRLEIDLRRRRLDEVRARVKAAEREGRVVEALQWMVELDRLERETRDARAG